MSRAALTALGIRDADIHAYLSAPSPELAERRLAAIQSRARCRFQRLALELHPDCTGNDPEKTERFLDLCAVLDTIMAMRPHSTLPPVTDYLRDHGSFWRAA